MAIPKTRAEPMDGMAVAYDKLCTDLDRVPAKASKHVCVDDYAAGGGASRCASALSRGWCRASTCGIRSRTAA